jgi:hypothetical protein
LSSSCRPEADERCRILARPGGSKENSIGGRALFYEWRAGDLRGRLSLRARVKVAAFIAIAVVVAVGVGLWFGASGQQRFVVHSSSGS